MPALCREHTDAVTGIAVSPEGALLVSASWDTSLRIWPTGLRLFHLCLATVKVQPAQTWLLILLSLQCIS